VELTGRIAGMLLAAGGGRRYGLPKALARDPDGRFFVERAAAVLRDGGCDPVVVVLGAAVDQVRDVARLDGCLLVDNPDWASGMGSSLRAGLAALAGLAAADGLAGRELAAGPDAAVVLLVDQPGVGPAAVGRVAAVALAEGPEVLATAGYPASDGGLRRGHPVALGRAHWAGVAAAATGDTGARPYLAARSREARLVRCGDIADDTDVDTSSDEYVLRRPPAPMNWGETH
jgi:nicotine blue oxidoreductase